MNLRDSPATRQLRRFLHRIGRRGAFLLFLAILDTLFALSLVSPPPEVRNNIAFRFAAGVLPLPVWAGAWFVTGLVCLLQAPTRNDRVAYGLATLLKVSWGSVYLAGWAVGALPRGWVAAAIWLSFGALVALIATWPEMPNMDVAEAAYLQAPDAIITADAYGYITSWNTAAEELFGWEADEVLGASLITLIPHQYRERHQAALDRARRTGSSRLAGQLLEMTALHRDGHLFPVELTIGAWESRTGVAFTGIVRHMRTPKVSVTREDPAR